MKVLLTCGGTGGHIYPAVAIAKELQKKYNAEIHFAGRAGSMEERILQPLFAFSAVRAWPLVRGSILENLLLPLRLLLSLWDAWKTIRSFKSDIVIGTGGYVSLPVVIVAGLLGKKVYLQEQNAVAGITNKIGAKFAQKVFVSSDKAGEEFGFSKSILSGNPIRTIPSIDSLERPILFNGYSKVVLVLGGSQGAKGVNLFVEKGLVALSNDTLLVWQCGSRNKSATEKIADGYSNVQVVDFIDDIYAYMQYADVLISRAGASTIAEITAMGKASILVPYPYATGNHQEENARVLERSGAAKVVLEKDDIAMQEILQPLLDSESMILDMEKASKNLAKRNAAQDIAQYIYEKQK